VTTGKNETKDMDKRNDESGRASSASIPARSPGPLSTSPPMGGYNGKILRINLTDSTIKEEPLPYEVARKYIGGAGFVAYFLWKELKAGIDPLGPENKIVLATGPVTGLSLQGASRFCAGAKSPLTNGIIKSEAGGFWMVDFKRAGYDALIIEGQSEKPVYLYITDGKVEIKNAEH